MRISNNLIDALENFEEAVGILCEAWELEEKEQKDAVLTYEYPSYLPSFDEFAKDIETWIESNIGESIDNSSI